MQVELFNLTIHFKVREVGRSPDLSSNLRKGRPYEIPLDIGL